MMGVYKMVWMVGNPQKTVELKTLGAAIQSWGQ